MSKAKTICTVCNYIYDEALGESIQGSPPPLKFEDLPDEWRCPECGSAKHMFQPCSCVSLPSYEQPCVAHRQGANSGSALAEYAEGALDKARSVGQLVAQRPLRACVLEQYQIDYCCGGKATLEDACRKKGLDFEEVLEKLLAADRKDVPSSGSDWTTASLKDLIDHIVTTYHQPLRRELSRVAQLAEKVAGVHGDNHPEMIEVLNIFSRFRAQLELHMQKEEMVLFSAIASMETTGSPQSFGCGGGIDHPIEVMTQEHDDAGEALCAMRGLTHDYTPPDDACNTFKVLLYSPVIHDNALREEFQQRHNNVRSLTTALDRLDPAQDPVLGLLSRIADALDEYVRWEEHSLFPAIEQSLDAEQMEQLSEATASIEALRSRPTQELHASIALNKQSGLAETCACATASREA